MTQWRFKLLYDGECPFCRVEARWLHWLDRHGRLALEDIAAPEFDPTAFAATLPRVDGHDSRRSFLTAGKRQGLETFRQAYRALRPGMGLRLPAGRVLRPLCDLFYTLFARYRVAVWPAVRSKVTGGRCSLPRA